MIILSRFLQNEKMDMDMDIEPRSAFEINVNIDAIDTGDLYHKKASPYAGLQIVFDTSKSLLKIPRHSCCTFINATLQKFEAELNRGLNVNTADSFGNTLLMEFVIYNRSDLVELLLSRNANVNLRNWYGATALMNAAFLDRTDCVQLLIQHDAKTGPINRSGSSAIELAKIPEIKTMLKRKQQEELHVILCRMTIY